MFPGLVVYLLSHFQMDGQATLNLIYRTKYSGQNTQEFRVGNSCVGLNPDLCMGQAELS